MEYIFLNSEAKYVSGIINRECVLDGKQKIYEMNDGSFISTASIIPSFMNKSETIIFLETISSYFNEEGFLITTNSDDSVDLVIHNYKYRITYELDCIVDEIRVYNHYNINAVGHSTYLPKHIIEYNFAKIRHALMVSKGTVNKFIVDVEGNSSHEFTDYNNLIEPINLIQYLDLLDFTIKSFGYDGQNLVIIGHDKVYNTFKLVFSEFKYTIEYKGKEELTTIIEKYINKDFDEDDDDISDIQLDKHLYNDEDFI